jgi:alkylhydroperoxidase family enzyme
VVAFKAGLNKEELLGLRKRENPASAFKAPREQALLGWTDLVASGPAPIRAEVRDEFMKHFDEAEVVELTMLIATTVALNRYATALELPLAEAHQTFLENEGLVFNK